MGSYPTVSPLPRPVGPESSAEAPVRQSRGGLFSVALAVFRPLRLNPGRYPAHCPAEFGLSSPAQHASRRPRGSDRPAACTRFIVPDGHLTEPPAAFRNGPASRAPTTSLDRDCTDCTEPAAYTGLQSAQSTRIARGTNMWLRDQSSLEEERAPIWFNAAALLVSVVAAITAFLPIALYTSPWDAVRLRVPGDQGNWWHLLVGAPYFLAFPMIWLYVRALFSRGLSLRSDDAWLGSRWPFRSAARNLCDAAVPVAPRKLCSNEWRATSRDTRPHLAILIRVERSCSCTAALSHRLMPLLVGLNPAYLATEH